MRYSTVKLILAAVACLSVIAVAQIPTIRITTKNNQNPTGTQTGPKPYVSITNFELNDQSNTRNNLTLTVPQQGESDSIRVRGNSTAGIDKKPYRIKFDKKQGLFGRTPAKSWLLLANYYDQTFALNAIAFRLGRQIMPGFTPSSQFVDVYINNQYKGIYQLTEQIQAGEGRVNIDAGKNKGWLVEFDYHDLESDQVGFKPTSYTVTTTNNNMWGGGGTTTLVYTMQTRVREPELGGCDTNPLKNCNIDNDTVKFVQTEINAMLDAVKAGNSSTYLNLMDIDSWAKYVLIQQFMDNFDFNSKTQDGALPGSNYAYKDAGKKIFAGPIWDFDLAAGVTMNDFPKHFQNYNEPIRPKHAFYQNLWDNSQFMCAFKSAWADHKSKFATVPAFIDSIANVLGSHVQANFTTSSVGYPTGNWGMMVPVVPKTEAEYKTETGKLKTWWTNRTSFFETEVNKLTCNTGSNPSSSSSAPTQSSSSSSGGYQAQLSCNLINQATTAVVNTPIVPQNIFSVLCGVSTVSDITWPTTGLTPTSVGNFNITVARPGNANTCPGQTATCTVPVVATAPSSSSTPSSSSISNVGFVCALSNPDTKGNVGTAIVPANIFTTYCNGRSTSNVTWPVTNLTPQSTDPFTITVNRPATAQDCQGMSATCTLYMNGGTTMVMRPKITGTLSAYAVPNTIVLQNVPHNAKIEIYNLQGKRIYFANSENSQILRIQVQTKGMYIIKASFGSENRILRVPVR